MKKVLGLLLILVLVGCKKEELDDSDGGCLDIRAYQDGDKIVELRSKTYANYDLVISGGTLIETVLDDTDEIQTYLLTYGETFSVENISESAKLVTLCNYLR